MVRKGVHNRQKAAKLLRKAKKLRPELAAKVEAILEEVGVESPKDLKGPDPARLEALAKVLEILAPLRGVSRSSGEDSKQASTNPDPQPSPQPEPEETAEERRLREFKDGLVELLEWAEEFVPEEASDVKELFQGEELDIPTLKTLVDLLTEKKRAYKKTQVAEEERRLQALVAEDKDAEEAPVTAIESAKRRPELQPAIEVVTELPVGTAEVVEAAPVVEVAEVEEPKPVAVCADCKRKLLRRDHIYKIPEEEGDFCYRCWQEDRESRCAWRGCGDPATSPVFENRHHLSRFEWADGRRFCGGHFQILIGSVHKALRERQEERVGWPKCPGPFKAEGFEECMGKRHPDFPECAACAQERARREKEAEGHRLPAKRDLKPAEAGTPAPSPVAVAA